jgi:hypothetical protein
MEDKYYTPDISEFYVEFECEKQEYEGAEWEKIIVKPSLWSSNAMWTWIIKGEKSFRVKYLDKEDIESLGFKYIKTHAGLNEDYFEHIDKNHYCDYDYDSKYLRIAINGNGDVTRFSGIIENKSELKKLLKQLNIC